MHVRDLATLSPIGRLGRYELLGRLAVGGMAEVFLAREIGPAGASRELVVKRVLPYVAGDPQRAEMFAQEARLSLRLQHPHICPIYEFGRHEGRFYLAMEWVRGVSLRALLDLGSTASAGLPVPIAVSIAADVAGALHHAHTATGEGGQPLRIVHRDVTPENILIGFDGVPRLIDFGVAKAATQRHQTEAGTVKGKFAYMPPEQYRGETLDGRADIFALGCCLYEILTGNKLYDRGSEYETVAAIMFDPDVPSIRDAVPAMPEDLDRIVTHALAKDRDARFPSAAALQASLVEFLHGHQHHVRAADVSSFVRHVYANDPDELPSLDRSPVLSEADREVPTVPPMPSAERSSIEADLEEMEDTFVTAARRKRRFIILAAVLLVAGALAASLHALHTTQPVTDLPAATRTR